MGEMREKPDVELLREYADSGGEAAFRELVTRYTDLVYSAVLRQLESVDLAGDITQGVFLDLARKARLVSERLAAHNSLAGWLHRSAHYAVLNHLRDTRRRVSNERQAMEQLLHNSDASVDWEQIRPSLDEALAAILSCQPFRLSCVFRGSKRLRRDVAKVRFLELNYLSIAGVVCLVSNFLDT